ncbi:unnamed protein product [Citrullus colocynthis]|uniref:Alpha 1,4-glycosyltransferase domain-containing protein n=1 Tax=Citrullus colocynthis TaxID=252529 RepID=A0ABP0XY34_9ROSI
MSETRAISPILPTILLPAIIFLICGDGIVYKVSIRTSRCNRDDDDDDSETSDSLVVPSNLSAKKAKIDPAVSESTSQDLPSLFKNTPVEGWFDEMKTGKKDPVFHGVEELNWRKKHPLLEEFMENFASNFDGSRWGYNGPFLVSRVIANVGARAEPGFNVTVLTPST